MAVCEKTCRRPRVLMIAPEFYPCQVISAHRTGKFCKYLPDHGYDVSVLTIDPRQAGWAVDEKLAEQVPEGTCRIEAFYPFGGRLKEAARDLRGWLKKLRASRNDQAAVKPAAAPVNGFSAQAWFAVPDKDIFWTPWVIKNGLGPARTADILYATAPPFSILVIAALLKRFCGRPLAIDLRDPWTISHLKHYPSSVHQKLDAWIERWTFDLADAIICNTEAVRSGYQQRYPELPASRFTVITNGYDEADFLDLPRPLRTPGKVRLGYFGKVYAGRDPGPLFRAARRAVDEGLIEARAIEFVFFGPSSSIVAKEAEAAGAAEMVSLNPTMPYAEALRRMAACDVLLIIGSGETDELHIPGKAFEYLAMRKPILALAGPGALDDLMKRYRFGVRVSPSDGEGLFSVLRALYDDIQAGRADKYLGAECANLSRRQLTGELAAVFDRLRKRRSNPSMSDAPPGPT